MSERASGRNECLQDTAGALGEGIDADRKETAPHDLAQSGPAPCEDRSILSPDCEHLLSADERSGGLAVAGYHRAFLPGLVSDALHRPAADDRGHRFRVDVLPRQPARVVSERLETQTSLFAFHLGHRDRSDADEYLRRH